MDRRFSALVVLSATCAGSAGCALVTNTDKSGSWTQGVPEKARSTTVGYDVLKLFSESEKPVPPPPAVPADRPGVGPVEMTVWWQTPDGQLHSEDRRASEVYRDASRYAGAVWVKVTPLNTPAEQLAGVKPVEPAQWMVPATAPIPPAPRLVE